MSFRERLVAPEAAQHVLAVKLLTSPGTAGRRVPHRDVEAHGDLGLTAAMRAQQPCLAHRASLRAPTGFRSSKIAASHGANLDHELHGRGTERRGTKLARYSSVAREGGRHSSGRLALRDFCGLVHP
jgi:hypothetical protein